MPLFVDTKAERMLVCAMVYSVDQYIACEKTIEHVTHEGRLLHSPVLTCPLR